MMRLARAAVAATQIMATGMKTASSVIRNRSVSGSLSGARGTKKKNATDPASQMTLSAIAISSISEMPALRGRS